MKRAKPYVYSNAEIDALLAAALALPPQDGLRRWTYHYLFGLIAVTVGLAGMPLLTYVVLDAIGAMIWLGLLAGLGYGIGQRAVDVANSVSHYSLRVTLGLMLVIFMRQMWTSRARVRNA